MKVLDEESEWESSIDSLKDKRDIDKLLEKYDLIKRDMYIFGEEKEKKVNYIKRVLENLDLEEYIKKAKDSYKRYLSYECLNIHSPNSLLFLLESMENDKDPNNRRKIVDILCDEEVLLDHTRYTEKILGMVGSSKIEESDLFRVIGTNLKEPYNIIRALKKVKGYYLPKKKFFVGHEFSEKEKEEELRTVIKDVLKEEELEGRLSPISIDSVALRGNLLAKISDEIKKAEFGIYDLSKSSKKSLGKVPNPNVILEVGIAKGYEKDFYILAKEGMDVGEVISNLSGEIYLKYKDSSDMKEKLRQIFKKEKSSLETLS